MSGPLADAVERLAAEEQVFEQDQESGGGVDPAAAILWGKIGSKEFFESQAFDDAIEDREHAHAVGVEIMACRLGAMADRGGVLGILRRLQRCCSGRVRGVATAADIIVRVKKTSSGKDFSKIVR